MIHQPELLETHEKDEEGHWVTIHGHPIFIPSKGQKKHAPHTHAAKPEGAKPGHVKVPMQGALFPVPKKSTPTPTPAVPSFKPKDKPDKSKYATKQPEDPWGDWFSLPNQPSHSSSGSGSKSSPLPKIEKPPRTPEEEKMHKLVKALGNKPIPRTAAGGAVFKNFDAPSVDDLQVLIAQAHKKYGGYWMLPKGGADLGEHIHDTASREVEEETGVKGKVIPTHEPHIETKTFGDRAKYDLPLATKTLKDANPLEHDFIDANQEALKKEYFTWENKAHYFLMQHTGGEPISSPDEHQEVEQAKFVSLSEAMKVPRIAASLQHLMPAIQKQWAVASGHQPVKGQPTQAQAPRPAPRQP